MARKVRDAVLDSKVARRKLATRGKPHYRALEPGLHLGYRKLSGDGSSGKWVARFYCGDRDYQTETLATADDMADADGITILSYAQAITVARRRMAERGQIAAGVTAGPLTVSTAIERYISYLDDNKKSGQEARYAADAFILPKLGKEEVAQLTADQLRDWLKGVKDSPARIRTKPGAEQKFKATDDPEHERRRKSTANRILTVLKAALNRQWREGHTPSDIAWRRVEPFEGADAARIRYLQMDEAKRLISACDPDFRRLVIGALETGARYGELCRMEVEDFSHNSGTVAVRASKSGKPRHIVLTDHGADFFRTITANRPRSEPMFTKADGKPWLSSHQAEPIERANERAGIDPPINFHGLRHTWASHAVMNGVPLIIVARNLGHSDTRMVEKHYGHLAKSYVADAIRANAPRFVEADGKGPWIGARS